MTKTSSKTKIAVVAGVAVLLAAGTAYAGFVSPKRGYASMKAECYDGSTMQVDQFATVIKNGANGNPQVSPGVSCQSSRDWKTMAQNFCAGKQSPKTKKSGINSYSLKERCNPSEPYGYGYGFQKTTKK